MAIAKKNINRFRRVYPGIRKTPRYEPSLQVEAGYIDFVNESVGSYSYSTTFNAAPSVTATVLDTTGNGTVACNIYISAISTTAVEITTSTNITGRVNLQIIGF